LQRGLNLIQIVKRLSNSAVSRIAELSAGKPATAIAPDLVDSTVAGGTKSDAFTYVFSAPNNGKIWTYTFTASPVVPGQTGGRYFFRDQSGVIRSNSNAAATIASAPIG
jgi:hypothetical protein